MSFLSKALEGAEKFLEHVDEGVMNASEKLQQGARAVTRFAERERQQREEAGEEGSEEEEEEDDEEEWDFGEESGEEEEGGEEEEEEEDWEFGEDEDDGEIVEVVQQGEKGREVQVEIVGGDRRVRSMEIEGEGKAGQVSNERLDTIEETEDNETGSVEEATPELPVDKPTDREEMPQEIIQMADDSTSANPKSGRDAVETNRRPVQTSDDAAPQAVPVAEDPFGEQFVQEIIPQAGEVDCDDIELSDGKWKIFNGKRDGRTMSAYGIGMLSRGFFLVGMAVVS